MRQNLQEMLQEMLQPILAYLPNLLAAVGILILGWLVALVVAALVKATLRRTTLDNRMAEFVVGKEKGKIFPVEKVVGKIVFYALMLFVLVAFFQALGLTLLTEPLNAFLNRLLAFAPQLLGAVFLAVAAWLVATGLRMLTTRALSRMNLDERVGDTADIERTERVPLSKTLGDVVYWLVFLLFLPAILGTLALEGLLQPVQSLVNKILEYAPNVLTAVFIVAVGWFVARVVQRIVTNLTGAAGLDSLGERVGFARALGDKKLSNLVGLIVYVLILVPVLVGALNALNLDAITAPASNMLDALLGAMPNLFAASLVLVIAYVVGRVVSGLVGNVLTGAGFDGLVGHLGIAAPADHPDRTPSTIAGWLLLAAIMLFATVEAADLLGFGSLADVFAELLAFGGRVVLALAVFALGFVSGQPGRHCHQRWPGPVRQTAGGARAHRHPHSGGRRGAPRDRHRQRNHHPGFWAHPGRRRGSRSGCLRRWRTGSRGQTAPRVAPGPPRKTRRTEVGTRAVGTGRQKRAPFRGIPRPPRLHSSRKLRMT